VSPPTGTAAAIRPPAPAAAPTPGRRGSSAAGTWSLTRFALRRDRIRLPLWVAGPAALVGIQASQSETLYNTPEALEVYSRTAQGSAALVAMTGRPVGLDSVARAAAFEVFLTAAVVVALMSIFTVVRHTRADEEAGRGELVRSTRVGRRAPLLAAVAVLVVANVLVAVATAAVAVGVGFGARGSLLLGASLAGVGLVHGALAAVAAQLSAHARSALALAGAAVGVSVLLRAAGDVQENALSWLSPVGWGQATYPYHLDRWWPLLLSLVAAGLLVLLALALLERRDHGAGMLPSRRGRATAGRGLGSPLGLAWRLTRGTVVGWTVGLAVNGLALGSLVAATEDLLEATPDAVEDMPIDPARFTDSFLALVVTMTAVLAGAMAVAIALRARGEEVDGRAEAVLATATSRRAWAGGHVVVALVGSALALLLGAALTGVSAVVTGTDGGAGLVGDVVRAAVLHVPAVWVLAGVAVLLSGLSARLGPLAWVALGWTAFVLLLGPNLDLPSWAVALSPMDHVPSAPLEEPDAAGPLALLALAGALVAVGLTAWRRRDLQLG